MPKGDIDYSNTIIYKIYCKDKSISDVYIGNTTNFIQRKYLHKQRCVNTKKNLKIYDKIRANGGWDNWDMVALAKYKCKDHTEAKIKEQEHYAKYNFSLNSIYKLDNKYCKICKKEFESEMLLKEHKSKSGHELNIDIIDENIDENIDKKFVDQFGKFYCDLCNYNTDRYSQYTRHLNTSKHKQINETYNKNQNKKYNCSCGKYFSHRQSLSLHKKKCNILNGVEDIDKDQPITKELVLQLIKQNQKLQEMLHEQHNKMFEIAKEGKSITNNTTNNNNNNQFNLNFFLNEQCKDALNLMEFVDSLNVQLKDLEYTASKGYAEGISNIFINALSDLNVHKRPIHCSDSKREILYIKDNGEWKKEDEDKSKLTKAIKIIGNKNMKQISEWQKAYPEYNDPSSKQNDKYMKMLCNAMSGSTKEESEKNYDKIIRNIAKEVVIDKSV